MRKFVSGRKDERDTELPQRLEPVLLSFSLIRVEWLSLPSVPLRMCYHRLTLIILIVFLARSVEPTRCQFSADSQLLTSVGDRRETVGWGEEREVWRYFIPGALRLPGPGRPSRGHLLLLPGLLQLLLLHQPQQSQHRHQPRHHRLHPRPGPHRLLLLSEVSFVRKYQLQQCDEEAKIPVQN